MTRLSPMGDAQLLPVRPPICIACAEGDHEQALRIGQRCTCPCHGVAMPAQAVAA
jgi:hypothetical protein